MKFSIVPVVTLLSNIPAVISFPLGSPPSLLGPTIGSRELAKRAVRATVKVDGLVARNCPSTSCQSEGQVPKGASMTLGCYTRGSTLVFGDYNWGFVVNRVGTQHVPLGGVQLEDSLPLCGGS